MNEPMNWSHNDPYNPEIGLWTQSHPGHTKPIAHLSYAHSGPNAASRLLVAASQGRLEEFPVDAVLNALSKLQVRDDSPMHGCCRWFAEEPEPVDTNASFFIGLNLIVLNAAYRSELSMSQQQTVDEMLHAFIRWFTVEAEEGKVHYPNKFLGDLVCLWLLEEQTGGSTSHLEPLLIKSARYWKEHHWGWGEHLSDGYSQIILDELSCLLLLSKSLPDSIRELYTDLFLGLIHIEDLYEGGPRVPTIRSYALNGQMPHKNYRQKIHPIEQDVPPDHNILQIPHLYMFPFGHVLNGRDWHELAGEQQSAPERGTIPCFDSNEARFLKSGSLRLGALSKFPIMPNTDQPTWGMSWQTMPAALSSEAGDWGFWRWGTKESGSERFYPAKDKHSAYLNNALTDTVSPVISGETFSEAHDHGFLILRRMPRLSKAWEWCSDQFTLHDFSGEIVKNERLDSGWHQLTLSWLGGKILTLFLYPLESKATPELTQSDKILSWGTKCSKEEIQSANQLNNLWMAYLGDEIPSVPEVSKADHWFEYPHFTQGDANWSITWNQRSYLIDHSGLISK